MAGNENSSKLIDVAAEVVLVSTQSEQNPTSGIQSTGNVEELRQTGNSSNVCGGFATGTGAGNDEMADGFAECVKDESLVTIKDRQTLSTIEQVVKKESQVLIDVQSVRDVRAFETEESRTFLVSAGGIVKDMSHSPDVRRGEELEEEMVGERLDGEHIHSTEVAAYLDVETKTPKWHNDTTFDDTHTTCSPDGTGLPDVAALKQTPQLEPIFLQTNTGVMNAPKTEDQQSNYSSSVFRGVDVDQPRTIGQPVILFDPSKDLISRTSLGDVMLIGNGAENGNIWLVNVQLNSNQPIGSSAAGAGPGAIVCNASDVTANAHFVLVPKSEALIASSEFGPITGVGQHEDKVHGVIPGVDPMMNVDNKNAGDLPLTNRKSDRLKAKPLGWKGWKGGEEWVDSIECLSSSRKRKVSSRLMGQEDDPDGQMKWSKTGETTIREHLDTDLGKTGMFGGRKEDTGHDPQTQTISASGGASSAKMYSCNICNKDFTTEKYLSMHMSLHNGNFCTSLSTVNVSGGSCSAEDLPIRRTKATSPGSMAQWTCKICEKTFAQNSNYKNHIRTHSNERPFVCVICSIGFKERYHLKKHVLFKHTTELKEKCRFCGKCFKDSTAVRAHERTHSDQRPYACTRCDKTFKTSECLWHHENRSKTCGKSLGELTSQGSAANNPGALTSTGPKPRRSRQVNASAPAEVRPVVGREQVSIGSGNGQLVGPSVVCQGFESDTVVQSQPTLVGWSLSDMRAAMEQQLDVGRGRGWERERERGSGVVAVEEGPLPAVKVEMEMSIFDYEFAGIASPESSLEDYCEELEKETEEDEESSSIVVPAEDGSHAVHRHHQQQQPQLQTQAVPPVPPVKGRLDCGKCGKQCTTQSAYAKHCIVHSETRPHRCDECDIGFKLKVHLKKHNLYRHSNEYPCECRICGKRFKDSSAVRLHERIHSAERPFKCHCGKSFKTRENLWGHKHRGPCDKSDGFLLQNLRVFNSDIGPIWGVPLNVGQVFQAGHQAVSAGPEAEVEDYSVNRTSFPQHHPTHAQQQQQELVKQILTSITMSTSSSSSSTQGHSSFSVIAGAFPEALKSGTGRGGGGSDGVMTSGGTGGHELPSRGKFTTSNRMITIASSSSSTSSGVYPPTAVVVPIKREVVDIIPKVDNGQSVVVSEKCSLPPFETLVTTHRPGLSSEVKSAVATPAQSRVTPAQSRVTSIADKCPTVQKILQMNAAPVQMKLPGIQQLFQAHSATKEEPGGSGGGGGGSGQLISTDRSAVHLHSLGAGLSSANRSSTSSPISLSGTELVLDHELLLKQHQQPGILYTHRGFSLPPPPPYPGISSSSSSSSSVKPGSDGAQMSVTMDESMTSSTCMPLLYWGGGGEVDEERPVLPPGVAHKNSSMHWASQSMSSTQSHKSTSAYGLTFVAPVQFFPPAQASAVCPVLPSNGNSNE